MHWVRPGDCREQNGRRVADLQRGRAQDRSGRRCVIRLVQRVFTDELMGVVAQIRRCVRSIALVVRPRHLSARMASSPRKCWTRPLIFAAWPGY